MTKTKDAWGASPKAWDHFAKALGWQVNLLPVVSNPNRTISEYSTLKGLGKVPSQVNFRGEATGFAKWAQHSADARDLKRWANEPDHGICVQTGKGVVAFDIDVPDPDKAAAIRDAIVDMFPDRSWPERYREGTGKTLLVVDYPWGDLYKRVLTVDGGVVEFLALGQQFIAEGTYIHAKSGRPEGRYLWRVGPREKWPSAADVPCLDEDEMQAVFDMLAMLFDVSDKGEGWLVARSRRTPGVSGGDLPDPGDDLVAAWIAENWNVYDHDTDGRLFIECPFADEHTTDSNPTATAYFPAGTGGYQRGHFDCKHAHCMSRSDGEFLTRIGYEADQFPLLDPGDTGEVVGGADFPDLGDPEDGSGGRAAGDDAKGAGRAQSGRTDLSLTDALGGADNGRLMMKAVGQEMRIEGNMHNVLKMIGPQRNMIGMTLAFDAFTNDIVWAPEGQHPKLWRAFKDTDYAKVRVLLERQQMLPVAKETLRDAVAAVADENTIDTAREWLSRLRWDGVERVNTFITDTMPGVADSDYVRGVSRYLWTALAGRVLQPGVKADMVPVLVGAEGLRKTSWVKALSPAEDAFAEINLGAKEDDTIRKLHGTLVAELGELQGLNSREGEEIRAFLSRQRDQWTPKFANFKRTSARRCLFIGTTNDTQFLEARMGMRRLLPFLVEGEIDVDRVAAERDQLWAEAAVLFAAGGVDWSVESVAQEAREDFIRRDEWEVPVARWLRTPDPEREGLRPVDLAHPEGFTVGDALLGALGIVAAQHDRAKQMRMSSVLRELGCERRRGSRRGSLYTASATSAAKVAESEGDER